MFPINQWIDRYQARVQLGEFLQRAAEWFAGVLFVFGTAVLVVRLWIPQAWPHVLWLAAAVIPAAAAAWFLARRHRQSRPQTVAMLDRALETGGLLMTLSERPDADWAARLPQLELVWKEALPRIRPKRFASYLALPMVFAVGACFVPLREASSTPVTKNVVAQEATQQLEELLDSLEETATLQEEEQQQLQEEIAKLAEETKQTPLTHEKWEIVDALREQMRARVETASATIGKFQDAADKLAKSAQGGNEELSENEQLQLEKDLQDSFAELSRKGTFSKSSRELQDRLERLTKNGRLQLPKDATERQELLDDLREHLDQEEKKLSELRKKCKACAKCSGGQCEDGECESDAFNELAGPDRDGRPGRGGVSRGRGDAALTWGDESDAEGSKFKEVALPPGFLEDPKDEIVKTERTAPIDQPAASAPRGTSRALDPAAGRSTWNRTLNPKHRPVVKKFFDSK